MRLENSSSNSGAAAPQRAINAVSFQIAPLICVWHSMRSNSPPFRICLLLSASLRSSQNYHPSGKVIKKQNKTIITTTIRTKQLRESFKFKRMLDGNMNMYKIYSLIKLNIQTNMESYSIVMLVCKSLVSLIQNFKDKNKILENNVNQYTI